jgi:hypothetical protein
MQSGNHLGISLSLFTGDELPIQFGVVDGYFDVSCTSIKSLRGFPHTINGSFACNHSGIQSLSGIDKIIKRISGRIICSHPTHMLGLLLIDGVTEITTSGWPQDSGPWDKLDQIMNNHLTTHDIVAAQDELIDAGYIQQAGL